MGHQQITPFETEAEMRIAKLITADCSKTTCEIMPVNNKLTLTKICNGPPFTVGKFLEFAEGHCFLLNIKQLEKSY